MMADTRGSAEQTRVQILAAARELFATRGIDSVTIRDVAAKAGVTHALIHRYFGTKEEIVSEIIRREIQAASALPVAPEQDLEPLEVIRRMLLYGLTDARNTLLLIARAELAGLEPEKMLADKEFRPIGLLADWLKQQQASGAGRAEGAPDAALTSAVVGGAIFALQTLGPWLMAAVGLKAEDIAVRREEILDILMDLVTRTAGLSPKQPS